MTIISSIRSTSRRREYEQDDVVNYLTIFNRFETTDLFNRAATVKGSSAHLNGDDSKTAISIGSDPVSQHISLRFRRSSPGRGHGILERQNMKQFSVVCEFISGNLLLVAGGLIGKIFFTASMHASKRRTGLAPVPSRVRTGHHRLRSQAQDS